MRRNLGGLAAAALLIALSLAMRAHAQKPGGILLYEDEPLEIQTISQLHEFVRVTRVAVFTGELAATIGIDHPLERHAR